MRKIILECSIPKILGYQAAVAVPNFDVRMPVPAQLVVAHTVAIFGLVDIFLDLEEHIPGPYFDTACRAGVVRYFRNAEVAWETDAGTVGGEEIAG